MTSSDACTLSPSFNGSGTTRDFNNTVCSVDLAWPTATSNCPTAPISGYRVERSTSPLFTSPVVLGAPTALGYLDTSVVGGTPYYYRVTALDNAGNASSSSPIINATPVGPQGINAPEQLDDVDTGTFMTLAGEWGISNLRASTGTFSYRSAKAGATYRADTCATITTQPFSVGSATDLVFDARWNLEQSWDGVVIEVSTNNGASWSVRTPVGGYPGTFAQTGSPPVNACGYISTQGAFTGSSGGVFVTKTLSLTEFAGGGPIQVRWRFSSDPGSEEEGFYLDNVRIPANGGENQYLLKSGFEDNEVQTASPGCVPAG